MADEIQVDAGPNGYVVALKRDSFVTGIKPLSVSKKRENAILFNTPESAYAVAEDLALSLERLGAPESAALVSVLRCRSLLGEADKTWSNRVQFVMDRYGSFTPVKRLWGSVATTELHALKQELERTFRRDGSDD